MTPAPISVERLEIGLREDGSPKVFVKHNGPYVRHSDYAALLHQLAEREAECERLAEIEHHVWHMLDEADDDGESIRIARDNPDHLALDALLPEDHP